MAESGTKTPSAVATVVAIALLAVSLTSVADTVVVTNVSELNSAVVGANNQGGDRTILVADGRYTLNGGLWIAAPNVTIASQSGNPESVIIEGDKMGPDSSVGSVITVAADFFTLRGVTLQNSANHLIQIKGEDDADSPVIRDCVMRDAYEQMLKVTVNLSDLSVSSDNGIVENCLFEYTAGIGPQFYIGGIDAHAADNWIVRGNTFRNIISPGDSVAQHAIHFWNGTSNTLVEKNLVVDCDRGIGFGLDNWGNQGGTIRNNMVYHAANRGAFADVGIALQNSPGSEVYNNTVYMEHNYPIAIEYRFGGTTGVMIKNNLVNRSVRSLDGAAGDVSDNVSNAQANWFVDVASGDLHLNGDQPTVSGQGSSIAGLVDDFDGDTRATSGGVDIGADEAGTPLPKPMPPTDLTAN